MTAFIQNLYRRKLRRGAEVSEESARQVSGIVYCRAKKTCDMVADALRKKGINAAAFHRGMKDTDADRNARLWKDAEALAKDNKKRVDCIGRSLNIFMMAAGLLPDAYLPLISRDRRFRVRLMTCTIRRIRRRRQSSADTPYLAEWALMRLAVATSSISM